MYRHASQGNIYPSSPYSSTPSTFSSTPHHHQNINNNNNNNNNNNHSPRSGHSRPIDDSNMMEPSFHRYGARAGESAARTENLLRQVREPGHSRYHTSREIAAPTLRSLHHPPSSSSRINQDANLSLVRQHQPQQQQQQEAMEAVPLEESPVLPPNTNPPPSSLSSPSSPSSTPLRPINQRTWWRSTLRAGEHAGAGIALSTVVLVCVFQYDQRTHRFAVAGDVVAVAVGAAVMVVYVAHHVVMAVMLLVSLRRRSVAQQQQQQQMVGEWIQMGRIHGQSFTVAGSLEAGQGPLQLPPPAIISEVRHDVALPTPVCEPLVEDSQIGVARTTSRRTSEIQRRALARARVEAQVAPVRRLIEESGCGGSVVDADSAATAAAATDSASVPVVSGVDSGLYAAVPDVVDAIRTGSDEVIAAPPSPQASSVYSLNKSLSDNSLPEDLSPEPFEPYSPLCQSNRTSYQSMIPQLQQQHPPLRSYKMATEVGTPEAQKIGDQACSRIDARSSNTGRAHSRSRLPVWSYRKEPGQPEAQENKGKGKGKEKAEPSEEGVDNKDHTITDGSASVYAPTSALPTTEMILEPESEPETEQQPFVPAPSRIPAPISRTASARRRSHIQYHRQLALDMLHGRVPVNVRASQIPMDVIWEARKTSLSRFFRELPTPLHEPVPVAESASDASYDWPSAPSHEPADVTYSAPIYESSSASSSGPMPVSAYASGSGPGPQYNSESAYASTSRDTASASAAADFEPASAPVSTPQRSHQHSYGSLGNGRVLPVSNAVGPTATNTPSRLFFRDGRDMTPITECTEPSPQSEMFM
ncbi:hypothetical protein F4810DRAFT_724509 [Camillea tinctor]|nr:hypothetical protein F4810DRAFT_724509 [Camillea tinctor]